MAHLTGLFKRGASFYLRVVLPDGHPLRGQYRNGCWVKSLGPSSYKDAVRLGTLKRAEIVSGFEPQHVEAARAKPVVQDGVQPAKPADTSPDQPIFLRAAYDRWVASKPRTDDSIAACNRALKLFEQQTGNPPLHTLTRSQGDAFRAWLQAQPTSSKTARDRLNWIKVLLKYACQDLELLTKSPWTGLDIKAKVKNLRKPWSERHLATLMSHPIWQKGESPEDKKAGGIAAFWIPLLAMYTGARCSELCQLLTSNIDSKAAIPTITFTDEAEGQRIKTAAGTRVVPIHDKLVQLGFLDYVNSLQADSLWPALPQRDQKPGGYFSQFFGQLRKSLGLPPSMVLHSFRHNVRTALTEASVTEPVIDRLLGHEPGGSVGARIYTHVPLSSLHNAVQTLKYAQSCQPHARFMDGRLMKKSDSNSPREP